MKCPECGYRLSPLYGPDGTHDGVWCPNTRSRSDVPIPEGCGAEWRSESIADLLYEVQLKAEQDALDALDAFPSDALTHEQYEAWLRQDDPLLYGE